VKPDGTGSLDPFPRAFQPGGAVEKHVRTEIVFSDSEVKYRYRQVLEDLARIRSDCPRPATPKASRLEEYANVLEKSPRLFSFDQDRRGDDFVLRYSLAMHDGINRVAEALYEKAWGDYIAQPDFYDQILGDLIPADFRAQARNYLAHQSYALGVNPSAAQDWSAYLERLAGRRQRKRDGIATGLPSLDAALGGLWPELPGRHPGGWQDLLHPQRGRCGDPPTPGPGRVLLQSGHGEGHHF
jgi:hypothetical protein